MLFPIDHGNSAMKTVNFVFPSGLIDNPIRPPVDTEMLEYDGKFWTLSGQRISYMRDKTKDERYFILTLFAIAKELEKSGNISPMVEADLAVGLPPEHYALVITVQSTPTDEQTLAKIQQMIDASVERLKDSMKFQIQQEKQVEQVAPTVLNQKDLDDMLDNLTIFDQ